MEMQHTQDEVRPGSAPPTAVRAFASSQNGQARQAGGQRKETQGEWLARTLGWFSIGLGLAEVAAPRRIEKLVGVQGDHRGLIRLLGMRKLPTASAFSHSAGPSEPSGHASVAT